MKSAKQEPNVHRASDGRSDAASGGTWKLRILHLSDLHEHGPQAKDGWRRSRVLGDAFRKMLDAMQRAGPIDLVCFTGDAAWSGKADEYGPATDFFTERVLKPLGLTVERFFPVPGNHDIERAREKRAWNKLRANYARVKSDELAEWMVGGGNPPPGFTQKQREKLLLRQAAYREWVGQRLGRKQLVPSEQVRLGYRFTLPRDGRPFDVHIIGLDSAWAAGDDGDAGKLLLTDAQVGRLTTDGGNPLSGFRLALVHHPLADLADKAAASRLIADNVDLLLRGHLHEPLVETVVEPDRITRQLAAGCLYESDRWPNACHVVELTLDANGRPRHCEVYFWRWSEAGHWYPDGSLYRDAPDGRLSWSFEEKQPRSPRPRPVGDPPELPPAGIFVGREGELRRMAEAVLGAESRPVVLCSLQGMAGVGKSYLAERFFRQHAARFPGGLQRLVLDPHRPPAFDALLGQLADQLNVSAGATNLAEHLRAALLSAEALLLVENVDSQEAAKVVARLVQHLHRCPVVVTGRYRGLGMGTGSGWVALDVRTFGEAEALRQLAEEWPPAGAGERAARERLVRELGYLPLAIHLAAGHLKLGAHDVDSLLAELPRTEWKLGPVDEADRLLRDGEKRERAVLGATFDLSLELLRRQLGAEAERLVAGLEALGHAPLAGFGVSLGAAIAGLPEMELRRLLQQALLLSLVSRVPAKERQDAAWRIHPLLAEMLRARKGAADGLARMTEWFVSRLPEMPAGQEEEQGRRWREVQAEGAALVDWLARVPEAELARVNRAGSWYAWVNGPFAAWMGFCERALALQLTHEERSDFLWTLARVAVEAGALDRALQAAGEKQELDVKRGAERDAALAAGVRAEVRFARGERDEALRIRQQEQLPVYEKLGDVHERALTLGKISDVHFARREFDEALRIRQHEELPVYEKLGDVRSRAVALGRIGNVLWVRGELDKALRILNQEVLPVFEELGSVRDILLSRWQIARILLKRNAPGDRRRAAELLRLALAAAEALRIPEAEKIRAIQREAGLASS